MPPPNHCDCCCPQIGFGALECGIFSGCCSPMSPIINLASDPSRLSECVVVFDGGCTVCLQAVDFASADWAAVESYVRAGGRLFLTAENQAGSPPYCFLTAWGTTLNSFLSTIGSTLSYANNGHGYVDASGLRSALTPGAANIAQGLGSVTQSAFGEVLGGTTVWTLDAYEADPITGVLFHVGVKTAMVVEQLGLGFVFLSGDANLSGDGWCDFVNRVWSYSSDQII